MVMEVNLKVEGYQQAKQILEQLPDTVQKRMFVVALRKAAKPLIQSAKEKIPKKTGMLARSIRAVRAKSYRRYETSLLILPVFSIYKKSEKENSFYARFVHFGTNERKTKKSVVTVMGGKYVNLGLYRGRVTPNPFLERAYNEKKQVMIDSFGDEMASAITQFAKKNFKPVP